MPPITDVVKNLIIINLLVFIVIITLETPFSVSDYFLRYPISSPKFKPLQIVTAIFAHFTPWHLIFNMLGLYFFGPLVESTLGAKRFLFLYLSSGLAGGLFALVFSSLPGSGASGALFGVTASLALIYPNLKMIVFPIPFEIKAIVLVIFYIFYSIYSGIKGGDNIGHFAHLGGAAMGAFLTYKWGLVNFKF